MVTLKILCRAVTFFSFIVLLIFLLAGHNDKNTRAQESTPSPSATPSPYATPQWILDLEPPQLAQPSATSLAASGNSTWTLSGGPDPAELIGADDMLFVYLNGNALFIDPSSLAGFHSPITFNANTGDLLRVVGFDYWGGLASLSSLWLHHNPTRKMFKLSDRVEYPGRWQWTFFDNTYPIPSVSENSGSHPEQPEDSSGMCEVASRGNLYSGNNLLSANDISYSAQGPSPSFSRAYSSQWSYNGPMGYGWTFNCNTSLDLQTEGSVVEIDETGAHYTYTIKADGTYEAPSGRNSVLTKNIADSTFLLTEKDQSTKKFRADGKLLYISDSDGNTMTFEYDTDNRLGKIKDSSDRETQLTYNANGKISKIVDPAQRKVEYTYDSDDNLIKVNDIAGLDTSYAYDSSHKLTTITSFDNKTYTFSYDSDGKLVSRTDYASDTSHITYDTATNTSTVKDPKGNVTTYKMDDKGRATSVIDPSGAETKYTWDDNNNVTEITDPRGGTQSFTFDAKGNMLTSTDQLGKTTTYTYTDKNEVSTLRDALGSTRQFFYDTKGNLLKEIDTNGTTVASYTYDSHGNRTAMTDASGHTYHFEYDTSGNLVKEKDPAGNSTTHTYDTINRRISSTDAKGRTTAFELGVKGQLITQTYPDGTTTKYEWYPCCAILKSVVDANLNSIQYFYDSKRRLVRTQDAASGSTSFEYDENSNRTAIIDPKGNRTTLSYDILNRLESIQYPDSTSESLAYYSYGPIKSKTDGNGAVTTFEYDATGKLTKKISPDGVESQFTYDDVGNRLSMTDRTGTYSYNYDNLYRPTKITLPSGKSITYSYDPSGKRVGMTDYAGKTYGYKYDIMDRLNTLTLPGREKIQYAYDKLSLPSKITYPNDTYTSYAYDGMNRIDSISNYHKALWKDRLISGFSYTYDGVGNRLNMEEKSSYGKPKKNVYAYDSLYRLAKVTYPNHMEESYTYDSASNRIERAVKKRRFCPCFDGWKWDDKACRKFVSYLFHPEYTTCTTKYDYDSANKLLTLKEMKDKATAPSKTITFEYDRNGNQTKESTLLCGSRKPTVNTYGYNYDNRMVSALIKGIKNYEFTYNEDGNRIKTKVSTERDYNTRCSPTTASDETIHLYDGSSMIMDLDSKGKVISTYSYGLGLNAIDSRQLKGYYHADALGSITEVTGKRGSVLRSYRYDVWGEITRGGEGKDVNPFLYVGGHGVRWQDSTLGIFHMRARWMNSQTGRFTQRDPIGFAGGSNSYTYSRNNPILYIDPCGLVELRPDQVSGCNGDQIGALNTAIQESLNVACKCKYIDTGKYKKVKDTFMKLLEVSNFKINCSTSNYLGSKKACGYFLGGTMFDVTPIGFEAKFPECPPLAQTVFEEMWHMARAKNNQIDPAETEVEEIKKQCFGHNYVNIYTK